ncbi:hypothetical protein SHIRM173S_08167 [Streptomyces hirsutus]
MRPLRLLLADDEHLIRGALAALLSLEDDLLVVAEAASGPEALAMARAHAPTSPYWICRCPAPRTGRQQVRHIAAGGTARLPRADRDQSTGVPGI